jgi:ketosteroid isomerase-like protein
MQLVQGKLRMRGSVLGLTLAFALVGGALAQPSAGSAEPMATITRFTDAVNKGDAPGTLAAIGPNPVILDDLAPYSWQGPGAAGAWLTAMGANAQAKGMTQINMRLLQATRIEVEGANAYVVVPGVLTYTFKDGHTEHADGVLTFALQQQAGGAWKIGALTWTGPREAR